MALLLYGGRSKRLGARRGAGAGALLHAFGDDPDLLHAGALGGIDHVDDVAVAQRAVAVDEHRLVLAVLEDGAQPLFEFRERDVLVIDGDLLVRTVHQHDLADRRLIHRRVGLGRQVDVETLLRQRQRGHEDDEEHEQHVDHRRDVHVGVRLRDRALEDRVGAVVLVRVGGHYLPPCDSALDALLSVISPTSSMPLARSWSIASMIALYGASSSALMRISFSFLVSRIASRRVRISSLRTSTPLSQTVLSALMPRTV